MAIGYDFVNGDMVINVNGKFTLIETLDKVKRDFYKVLKTDIENINNPSTLYRYNPEYGTGLYQIEFLHDLNRETKLQIINTLLSKSLSDYISLQESRDNLSLEETILYADFEAYFDSTRKDTIHIDIVVKTLTGDVDLSTTVEGV